MSFFDWLLPLLILLLVIGLAQPIHENFVNPYEAQGLLGNQIIPIESNEGSVKDPETTWVDHFMCRKFAKRSCYEVRFHDRFQTCLSGQYQTCLEGRQKPLI